jgi:hypothetical protein
MTQSGALAVTPSSCWCDQAVVDLDPVAAPPTGGGRARLRLARARDARTWLSRPSPSWRDQALVDVDPLSSLRSAAATADNASFAANRIRKKSSGRGDARLRLARA